ncbi:MAG: non-hydrolyzing UDP-N-acetylglucosamine 2-epimerase [Patescibacteria group bacterium]|jgi:UDP-N-acetylglucosamine 2-epimerase (non-hydrolysing)
MRIAFILGTRPEVIKLAPLLRRVVERGDPVFLIHTNQHYSANMDAVFFEELALPAPTHNLRVGSGSHGEQTAKMLLGIEPILIEDRPDVVVVQGDTNTVVAGALAAAKLGIPLAHVEAGLRSGDRTMPEELNRIVTDHLADALYAPTDAAKQALVQEGIPVERILVTGNTAVDAVLDHRAIALARPTLGDLGLTPERYVLLTLHRPSNVDDRNRLSAILDGLAQVARATALPIIFPVHPRTAKQLELFGLALPEQVRTIEPMGYLDFLALQAGARLILTDSGGIQEEACTLDVPCVTLRENTERPETIRVGANRLAGTSSLGILAAVEAALAAPRGWQNPLGAGTASEQILHALMKIIPS